MVWTITRDDTGAIINGEDIFDDPIWHDFTRHCRPFAAAMVLVASMSLTFAVSTYIPRSSWAPIPVRHNQASLRCGTLLRPKATIVKHLFVAHRPSPKASSLFALGASFAWPRESYIA